MELLEYLVTSFLLIYPIHDLLFILVYNDLVSFFSFLRVHSTET